VDILIDEQPFADEGAFGHPPDENMAARQTAMQFEFALENDTEPTPWIRFVEKVVALLVCDRAALMDEDFEVGGGNADVSGGLTDLLGRDDHEAITLVRNGRGSILEIDPEAEQELKVVRVR